MNVLLGKFLHIFFHSTFDLIFFVLDFSKSASCTHVSALLHALASLSPPGLNPHAQNISSDEETALPVTSYLCKWNVPRKRKESSITISESVFHKHVYGRQRKHELKSLEDFDPRPVQLRGKAEGSLIKFLGKVRGQGLGVSLLRDNESRCWSINEGTSIPPTLPTKEDLQERVEEFKRKHLFEVGGGGD